jgi:hypothetical protein
MDSTPINPQLPTIHSTISTNSASENISSGSAGTAFENDGVHIQLLDSNSVDTRSIFMHTSTSQVPSGSQAISNLGYTQVDPHFQDGLWPISEDNTNPRQHDDQIEVGGLNTCREFDLHQMAPGSLDAPGIPRDLWMAPEVDRSYTHHNAQSIFNTAPSVQYSHEQSASVLFHQQFELWGENLWRRSVPTPGTRYSLTFPPGQSSRNLGRKSNARKHPFQTFERHLAPSVNDSVYGLNLRRQSPLDLFRKQRKRG